MPATDLTTQHTLAGEVLFKPRIALSLLSSSIPTASPESEQTTVHVLAAVLSTI